MSYSTPEKVKSMFREFAGPADDPAVTDVEIQEFLDDAAAEIDAKIGTLYTLPITSVENPKSFSILKKIETLMVAAIVDDILNSYGEADKKPIWGQKAERMLKELVPPMKNGKQSPPTMKLQDATYLGTKTETVKMFAANVQGPTFTKGGDNW